MDYLTTKEWAKREGVPLRTAQQWAKNGWIPSKKLTRYIRKMIPVKQASTFIPSDVKKEDCQR